MNTETLEDPVAVGILGLGTAGRHAATVATSSPFAKVAAVCDTNLETSTAMSERFATPGYTSIQQLCDDPMVEAVYISTPTYLHLANALQLASAGKHLLVEKPVVKDSSEGEALVTLANDFGVQVMAVNTRGRDAPVRAMARIVEKGSIGNVLSLTNISYTDWVIRPRYAYELVTALGGGVAFRQAPHQVEIARTIINRPVVAVTSIAGRSPSPVDTVGNYSALLEFAGGVSASLVYNGYGYFNTAELTYGKEESGREFDPGSSARMRENKSWSLDKYGDAGLAVRDRGQSTSRANATRRWGFVGLTIISGDRGDMRQSEDGVTVYDENGSHQEDCSTDIGGLGVDFDEFYQALRLGGPLEHDARWGATTVRICEAIWNSHCEGRRIDL
jgi:phthalate 4,5-cis-dihydrodiol dehydrogenase